LLVQVVYQLTIQYQLKPKDKLHWRWEVIQGKMVGIVEKYGNSSRRPSKTKDKK
jgi:hypothetical protein